MLIIGVHVTKMSCDQKVLSYCLQLQFSNFCFNKKKEFSFILVWERSLYSLCPQLLCPRVQDLHIMCHPHICKALESFPSQVD